MFRLPNVDQKLQGIIQDKIEVSDDFSMAHNLKEENIKKKWENIQKITMKNSQVSNKAIQLLVSHPICKQIQSLELQSNFTAINDNTLQIIAGSNYLLNLKELNLSDDTVTDDGMIYLMASNVSANLESLILYGNFQVSSASLKAIAGSKECKKLEYLDLRSTYVSDIGFKV